MEFIIIAITDAKGLTRKFEDAKQKGNDVGKIYTDLIKNHIDRMSMSMIYFTF